MPLNLSESQVKEGHCRDPEKRGSTRDNGNNLAPYNLPFLRREEVYFWFASVLPLLRAVEGILFMVHTKQQLAKDAATGSSDSWIRCLAEQTKYNLTRPSPIIHMALGFSMTVFLFCLHGLRVLCPKVLQGKGRCALLIFGLVVVAHLLFLSIETSRIDPYDQTGAMCLEEESDGQFEIQMLPNYPQVMMETATHLYMWMIPLTLPLVCTGSTRSRFIWCACTVILEVASYIWGETPNLELRTIHI